MKNLIAAAALAALACGAAAAEEPKATTTVELAEAWLDAYSTFEPAKMAPFLADDATFSDPTSTNQTASGGPFMFDGKAAILKGLGDYAAQYEAFSVRYDVERRYESGGFVVFVAGLAYDARTKDGKAISGGAPIVSVVGVRDGRIISHTDYFDYAGNAVETKRP